MWEEWVLRDDAVRVLSVVKKLCLCLMHTVLENKMVSCSHQYRINFGPGRYALSYRSRESLERKKLDRSRVSNSESLGVCSEKTGVDSVNHRGGSNHSAAKIPAVQTLDGILTARDLVEFEVDISLGVGIDGDVDDVTVFGLGLSTHVVFKLLDPVVALFPFEIVSQYVLKLFCTIHLLVWVKHVV